MEALFSLLGLARHKGMTALATIFSLFSPPSCENLVSQDVSARPDFGERNDVCKQTRWQLAARAFVEF